MENQLITLSFKERNFCAEYIRDMNHRDAAERSGFSPNMGAVLMKNEFVLAEISRLVSLKAEDALISIEEVISSIIDIREDAMRLVTKRDGNLAMTSRPDALKANELLGKYLGLFAQQIDVNANVKHVYIRGEDELID